MIPHASLLLDTDILAAHLVAPPDSPSLLRRLLPLVSCMTSVLHAAELLALARTEEERAAVDRVLLGIKVVGLNGRYAITMARLRGEWEEKATKETGSSSSRRAMTTETAALAALAIESRRTVVTDRAFDQLQGIAGLHTLRAEVLAAMSDDQIRAALPASRATGRSGE